MTARQDEPLQRLPLSELDTVRLDPVLSPMPTAVEAVRDVVSDRRPAVLTAWQRRTLRSTLPRRTIRALGALRPSGMPSDGAPNEVLAGSAEPSMRAELDRMASEVRSDAFGLGIERATKAGRPTAPWMVAYRDPAGWLEDYVEGLRLVWAEVRPLWSGARNRLEHELERLRAASDRGVAGQVVSHAAMPGRAEHDQLVLPSHTEESGRLRVSGSLRLVPVLADLPDGGWGDDYADTLLSLRYAMPADRSEATDGPADPDSLAALLGAQRAEILLALERPLNPGEVSERLWLTASGVSHHLAALEAAQLVSRTREGRNVVVRRTARATALLALYDRA